MPDITFDDLIKAKTAATQPKQDSGGGGGLLSDLTQEGVMEMLRTGLSIIQEVKGIQASQGSTIASRPAGEQTQQQTEAVKPMIDTDQIKEALLTVKSLKGDVNISTMLKLLEENKEAVAVFLKDV